VQVDGGVGFLLVVTASVTLELNLSAVEKRETKNENGR
jgi:hypothetical protein